MGTFGPQKFTSFKTRTFHFQRLNRPPITLAGLQMPLVYNSSLTRLVSSDQAYVDLSGTIRLPCKNITLMHPHLYRIIVSSVILRVQIPQKGRWVRESNWKKSSRYRINIGPFIFVAIAPLTITLHEIFIVTTVEYNEESFLVFFDSVHGWSTTGRRS